MSQSSNDYQQQNEDSVYKLLTKQIIAYGEKTLAGADYQDHFTRKVTEKGHYKYVATNDSCGEDRRFLLFGETCPMSEGTQLSSRGNKTNYGVSTFSNH